MSRDRTWEILIDVVPTYECVFKCGVRRHVAKSIINGRTAKIVWTIRTAYVFDEDCHDKGNGCKDMRMKPLWRCARHAIEPSFTDYTIKWYYGKGWRKVGRICVTRTGHRVHRKLVYCDIPFVRHGFLENHINGRALSFASIRTRKVRYGRNAEYMCYMDD